MSSIHDSYLGLSEELTYATAVAPARFLELVSEGMAGKYERIESEAHRAGQRVLHRDRFQPNPKGAEGDLSLEVLDGSFGLLLKHCLGTVASAAPVGGFTVHTVTQGDLRGKSLTVQVGRTDNTGTVNPFTYDGCKVKDWELSNAVDGILKLKVNLDSAKENIGAGAGAYALATPSYGTTNQLLTFIGGTVSVGGVEFAVSDVSFKGDNSLKTDRFFIQTATGKKEPLEENLRKYTFDLTGEYESLTHANRVAATVNAGTLATLSTTWNSPQGGQLVITCPVARFDTGPVNYDGAKIIEQGLKGAVLWDGTTSPVTIAYKSKDAAP